MTKQKGMGEHWSCCVTLSVSSFPFDCFCRISVFEQNKNMAEQQLLEMDFDGIRIFYRK